MLYPYLLGRVASPAVTGIYICPALGRGVTRSKQLAISWLRKAAENGHVDSCSLLASKMYADLPYAREVGHVGEAVRVALPAGVTEGHDVPPDVLRGVIHWLRKSGLSLVDSLKEFRRRTVEGEQYCCNVGCEVVGQLKEFKVCPQCKEARYCGDACQRQDWTTGGHKATCGTHKLP
jgi:TPR repeat protein